MNSSMNGIKRSLMRSILRETRQLKRQPSAGLRIPAIYDVCNKVNPLSGGIILHNNAEYRNFARSSFNRWVVSRELLQRNKLRAVLPPLLDTLDEPARWKQQNEFFRMQSYFVSNNPMCPFEFLRTLKYQNSVGKAASSAVYGNVKVQAVTGFAKEVSGDGENVYSYNITFTNTGDRPVRILGHTIRFSNGAEELKSGYWPGVNSTVPVIEANQHYVCGSTVAFPEKLDDIHVSGSFTIIEEGHRDSSFERLSLEDKHGILSNAVKNNSLQDYKVELSPTKFCLDVPCDTQRLDEKQGFVEQGGVVAEGSVVDPTF